MSTAPFPLAVGARVGVEPPDPGYLVIHIDTMGGQRLSFCLTAGAVATLRTTAALGAAYVEPRPGGELRPLAGVDVVEVPALAYEAALELLCDLLDAGELVDGDVCPLCRQSGAHEVPCVVGRARVLREALNYSNAPAQAAAVARLGRTEAPHG